MGLFQTQINYPSTVITTYSSNAIALPSRVFNLGSVTTSAWPNANQAFYIPFVLRYQYLAAYMFWQNGATVGTNNVDVGIYDAQGNRLVSSGSTATSGASGTQSVNITDTLLQPGLYYLAMAMNGTTDTVGIASGSIVYAARTAGVLQQGTAFPLPSTATFATTTLATTPMISVSSVTVI